MKNNKLLIIGAIIVIGLFMFSMKKESGESSSRSFTSPMMTNTAYTISIQVTPGTSTYYMVDEVVPSGWTVTSASDSGDYTTNAGHIFWTVLSGATSKTYTYTINTGASTGTKTFAGTIGFESAAPGSIGGSSSVTVSAPANCNLPWGGTLNHGSSTTAYQVASGETCPSESRTCNNGVLSGSYTYQSCSTCTLISSVMSSISSWKSNPTSTTMQSALTKIGQYKSTPCA